MDGAGGRDDDVMCNIRCAREPHFLAPNLASIYNNKANATRLPDNESVNDARALYTKIVLGAPLI
jgi:hypothetical protein